MPRKNKTKHSVCVHCGKQALRMNSSRQPVCVEHKEAPKKEVGCPSCGLPMKLREGRYGYFWGCTGYPQCQKTYNVKALTPDPDEEKRGK